MIRFYFKVMILSFVVSAAVVLLLIRAQPYDDHDLRLLLVPEDCEMPCFMGIRPGVTTAEEAMQILEASGWVEQMTIATQYASRDVNEVTWRWNDQFPFGGADLIGIVPYGNFMTLSGDVVKSMVVATTLSLADLSFIWNEPAQYGMSTFPKHYLYYAVVYPEEQVRFMAFTECPYFPRVWTSATSWVLGDIKSFETPLDKLNDGLFLKRVARFSQSTCGR
jgi:hypothetical protein